MAWVSLMLSFAMIYALIIYFLFTPALVFFFCISPYLISLAYMYDHSFSFGYRPDEAELFAKSAQNVYKQFRDKAAFSRSMTVCFKLKDKLFSMLSVFPLKSKLQLISCYSVSR